MYIYIYVYIYRHTYVFENISVSKANLSWCFCKNNEHTIRWLENSDRSSNWLSIFLGEYEYPWLQLAPSVHHWIAYHQSSSFSDTKTPWNQLIFMVPFESWFWMGWTRRRARCLTKWRCLTLVLMTLKKKLLQPSNYGYIMIYTCHLTIYIPSKYLTSSIENHRTSSIYDPNQPYTEEQLGAPHIRCQVTLLECTRHLQLGQITSAHGLDRKGEAENHSFLICLVVQ